MEKKQGLFARAVKALDASNSEDPNRETWQGRTYPKELLYAERMSKWLDILAPDATEAVKLAARAQHIRRWEIPRTSYPEGRTGYLRWRTQLYKFHAQTAAKILREVGYDESTIATVEKLLRKEDLKNDPQMQLLEDVICLVFLENYFVNFSEKHGEEKIIQIVQKTWQKMSERAQQEALKMDLPPVIRKALAGE